MIASLLFWILAARGASWTPIKVGGHALKVEVAATDEERQRGLMYRHALEAEQGMLFVFERSQVLAFWMKNTFIPLAIGYFDKNCTLIDIQEMKPVVSEMESPSINYVSKEPGQFALEVNSGWFSRKKVGPHARLELVQRPNSSTLSACYHKY